jgi:hypothetical protein
LILYNQSSGAVDLQPLLMLCAVFGQFFDHLGPEIYRFSGDAGMSPVSLYPVLYQRYRIGYAANWDTSE